MTRKILVLENQRSQFEKIKGFLNDYEVHPVNYSSQMELLRVVINHKRYFKKRVDTAFDAFYDGLKDQEIELIIMDFKLAGSFDGDNGIELAIKLRNTMAFANTPIIFLSRTPKNDPKIIDHQKMVDNSEWVEKSYFGEKNLEREYFNRHVLKLIKNTLGIDKFEKTLSELIELIAQDPYRNFVHRLIALKDKAIVSMGFSQEQQREIAQLHKKAGNLTSREIETALKEMEK